MSTLTLNQLNSRLSADTEFAANIFNQMIALGVEEFCLCPGSRNSVLAGLLIENENIKKYYWYEERSAGFFALGRARKTGKPVAIVTTSGTAAGELLPAAMEAYYNGTPLLLVTADRPRSFRGKGAPQSAEQVGLFGVYAPFAVDLSAGEHINLFEWDQKFPAHVNICLEEPIKNQRIEKKKLISERAYSPNEQYIPDDSFEYLNTFLEKCSYPLVVVSTLKKEDQEEVVQFLMKLNAPVYLEAISGLREDPRLNHLKVARIDNLWNRLSSSQYHIDGVLRIGGVPTFRIWRDIEEREGDIPVCSISDVPFSGLSWGSICTVPLKKFFHESYVNRRYESSIYETWFAEDLRKKEQLHELFSEEPCAEQSLMHCLSQLIPNHSTVYLGNSLPIREWDMAATRDNKDLEIYASRGLNGIDGQISTFIGFCDSDVENWGIFGDLTTLYDMAGPWILSQLPNLKVNIVVINNGGGKIFDAMYPYKEFQNEHNLSFEHLAKLWGLHYEKWTSIPNSLAECDKNRLIEIIPDNESTKRFLKKLQDR